MNNRHWAVRLPIFIGLAIALGIFIGANMAGGGQRNDHLNQSVNKFRQVLIDIETDFVDEVDTDQLVETAIKDVLGKLDPHSVYFSAEELAATNSQLEGNFEGIGIEFNVFKDTIHVVSAISGGPSESLGIKSGDKIIKVDDKNVAGIDITNNTVISLLRGEKGSKVKVSIKRKGTDQLLDFNITRDVIPQYTVDVTYMVNDETGYLKINRFGANTHQEFRDGIIKLQKAGMKNLILDLTGNPGGYLDAAVKISDEFLGGKQMIVYTKGKSERNNSEYFTKRDGLFEQGPLVILINEGSASASEIVAGAVQDHDRGIIVGRRSFGKGLVQVPFALNDGSAMRLTVSRYYIPSGRSIQKPFDGSLEDYQKELYDRFEHGEVYSQDSVKINDSLVFKTDKGRIVYAGGGITPDYFVPLDTTFNSPYMNRLFNSNSVAEYTVKYAEDNKAELEKMSFNSFRSDFKVSDSMLQELMNTGAQNGITYNPKQFEHSKKLLKIYVKAFIARSIWKNEGFYPIWNEQNEIVQKGASFVDEAEKLTAIQ